jgi:Uma2 family endonuclease
MATVSLPLEQDREEIREERRQRFVFRAVDWSTYQAFQHALGERHLRLTFDGENLEIMTVSLLHDFLSRLLGRFLVVLTEELDMPLRSAGSMTLDQEDVNRGLEPDECFYIINEPRVRGKKELDLERDPPPDLGMEIDISRSSLNRLAIYAAIKVPEVWRYDGENLFIYQLNATGEYELSARSKYFRMVPMEAVKEFLSRKNEMDENSLVKLFRAWVREQIAKEWKN